MKVSERQKLANEVLDVMLRLGGGGALVGGALGAGSGLLSKEDKLKRMRNRGIVGALAGSTAGLSLPFLLEAYNVAAMEKAAPEGSTPAVKFG